MVRLVSLAVLTAAIAVLGVMFFRVVAPYLLPLFLAAVAAVICQPSLRNATKRLKGRDNLAAGLVTGMVLAGILIPATAAVVIASLQAYSFSQQVSVESLQSVRDRSLDYASGQLVAWQDYLPTGVRAPSVARTKRDLLLFASETRLIDPPPEDVSEVSEHPELTGKAARDIAFLNRLPKVGADEKASDADRNAVAELEVEQRERLDRLRTRYATAVELAGDEAKRRDFYRDELTAFVNQARASLDETILGVAGKTVGGTLGLVGQTLGVAVGALVTLGIFTFALYYFLADGPKLIDAAESLIPVQQDYQRELLGQFATVVRAVVLATFLAALVQGVLATAALWACGFDHLLLLLVAAVVASLIPVAGTTLVWLPCAVILAAQGRWVPAVLLALWGGVVVGTMDNVVRTYVLNNDTKLHPLLALISVLGGLQVMGFWGVFVGPIVASCLHALVKIFNQELGELSKERLAAESSAIEGPVATPGEPVRVETPVGEPEAAVDSPTAKAGKTVEKAGGHAEDAKTQPASDVEAPR